ncbi:MAG: hypothetical protein IPO60_04850 [Flavobacteriales bacterium]|jgi:Flp pilus assembly protein TadB|nr:hypothetical protein [Flavobacteriales bacterium]MBK6892487.1 hypothetical protein [Flavobacteriales bacterium]MBK7246628.1 hypothetical protein [Flavobacteriales bacterium]MBK7286834.1 hypothetical protein [Flavobacteriales bacterium]MBK9060806.1 hypothetical protein [Flavobacteriales bacterium]
MKRRILRLITVLLLVLAAAPVVHAQEGISKKKQDKIQRDKKKNDVKEVKKEEKRIAKKHLANQGKATRKRMKRHKRRADKQGNSGHRDPFLRRLFGSKH